MTSVPVGDCSKTPEIEKTNWVSMSVGFTITDLDSTITTVQCKTSIKWRYSFIVGFEKKLLALIGVAAHKSTFFEENSTYRHDESANSSQRRKSLRIWN